MFNAINGPHRRHHGGGGARWPGDASHADAAINGGPVMVQGGATFGGYGSVKGNVSNAGIAGGGRCLPGLGGGAGPFVITGNLTNSGTVNLAGPIPAIALTVTGNYWASQACCR